MMSKIKDKFCHQTATAKIMVLTINHKVKYLVSLKISLNVFNFMIIYLIPSQ